MNTVRNTWKSSSLAFVGNFIGDKSKSDRFELIVRLLGEFQLIICIIQTGTDYPGAKVSEFTSTINNVLMHVTLLGVNYENIEVPFLIGILGIYFAIWIVLVFLSSVFSGRMGVKAVIALAANCIVLLHSHVLDMYINLVLFTLLKPVIKDRLSSGQQAGLYVYVLLNNVCGVLGARFGYCKLNGMYSMGMRVPDHGTISFFYKLTYAIFRTFLDLDTSRIARVALTMAYHVLLWRDFSKSPFHHLKTSMYFIVTYTFQIAWTLGTLINIVQVKHDWSFLIYFSLILNVFFLKMAHSHFYRLFIRICAEKLDANTKSEYFFIKIQVAEYLIKEGQNLQLIKDYKLYDLLFTQTFKNIDMKKSPLEITEMLGLQVRELYNIGVQILNDDNLRLMRAYDEIENKKHPTFKVMIDLLKLRHYGQNFDIVAIARELIERYKISISRKTITEQNVDVKEVFDFYDSRYQFLKDISNSVEKYIQFWKKDSTDLKLVDLFDKAIKMTEDSKKIWKTWRRLQNVISKSNKLEALNFAMYLYYVRSAPFTSMKILKDKIFKARAKEDLKEDAVLVRSLEDVRAITFLVDVQYDGQEKIIFATNNASQLGYDLYEFKQMMIGDLFPGIYKTSKLFSMLEYGEKVKESAISRSYQMFLKTKDCLLINTICYTCPLVRDSRLLYLLIVIPEPEETPSNYVIVSENYSVEAWTEAIGKVLKINLNVNQGSSLNINEVFGITRTTRSELGMSYEGTTARLIYKDPYSRDTSQNVTTFKSTSSKIPKNTKLPPLNYIPEIGKTKKITVNSNTNYPIGYEITREVFPGTSSICLKFRKTARNNESFDSSDVEQMINQIEERSVTIIQYRSSNMDIRTNRQGSNMPSGAMSSNDDLKKKADRNKADSINSIAISKTELEGRLEDSIYKKRTRTREKLPNYGVVSYVLLTIFLMVIFLILSLNTLDDLPRVFEVSGYIYTRHLYLWEWVYYVAATLELQLKGLILGREGMTPLEYFSSNVQLVTEYCDLLIGVDRQILKNIPVFEPDLQDDFYRKIPLVSKYMPELPETAHIFELDNRIDASGHKIYNLSFVEDYTLIKSPNPDISFIASNVLNDQYLLEESFYPLIEQDIRRKLGFLRTFCLGNNLVILSLGIFLFFGVFFIELEFIRNKMRFSDALRGIKENELEGPIKEVEKFKQYQDNLSKLNEQFENILKKKESYFVKSHQKEGKAKYNSQRMSADGVNRMTYLNLFFIFLIIAFILGISFGIQGILSQSSDLILKKFELSIQASTIFNQLCAITIPLYQYINNNRTLTMKNLDYSYVFKNTTDDLSHIQSFYIDLLNYVDADLKESLEAQFNTDLCNFVPEGECLPELESAVKNGALSFYSYVLKLAKTIKQNYDNSNRTAEAQFEVLNSVDYVNIELSSYYLPNTTQTIQNIMQTQVLRTISGYRTTMMVTFGCYCSFFLLFLVIVWGPIWNKMSEQRLVIYEMMKMVPLEIMKSNVYIKTFWNDFAGKGLGKIIKD